MGTPHNEFILLIIKEIIRTEPLYQTASAGLASWESIVNKSEAFLSSNPAVRGLGSSAQVTPNFPWPNQGLSYPHGDPLAATHLNERG